MLLPRLIPCLLVDSGRLVKTTGFRDPVYVGDPINAVRIFSEKEADELVVLDIGAHRGGSGGVSFDLIAEMTGHCFIPISYGGGIRSTADIRRILRLGVEKVVINSAAYATPGLITEAAAAIGSSSVVVCVDYRISCRGKPELFSHGGVKKEPVELIAWLETLEALGAGEIILNSIDREGTMSGYDLETLAAATSRLSIPLIASGGAGKLEHCRQAMEQAGASACAAGSMFVFHGKRRAVLLTYPERDRLGTLLEQRTL